MFHFHLALLIVSPPLRVRDGHQVLVQAEQMKSNWQQGGESHADDTNQPMQREHRDAHGEAVPSPHQ